MKKHSATEARAFYLMAAPWLIGFILLVLGPMIQSFFYSLTSWRVIDEPQWLGLDNYIRILTKDSHFWAILGNTVFYAVLSVPLNLVLAFALAALLMIPFRGRSVFQVLVYIPSVVPVVVLALAFQFILRPEQGPMAIFLGLFGIVSPDWLNDALWSKPALVLLNIWRIGFTMVLFTASMRAIPKELYECAEMDGATWWTKEKLVTIPMLSPIILYNLVVGLVGSLKVFTEVYVLTGGGPYYSSQTIVPYIVENAFAKNRFGYASAMSWIFFVLVVILSYFTMKRSEMWVFYETEVQKRKPGRKRS